MSAPFWPAVDRDTELNRLWLSWLVRLRWVAITAQLLTLSLSVHLFPELWVFGPLVVIVGLLVLANVRLLQRLGRADAFDDTTIVLQLLLDVGALTGIFLLAGGSTNPFVELFLIHIALAAVMVPARKAALVTGTAVVAYLLVSWVHLPLVWTNHTLPPDALRVIGETMAFTITAASVSVFVVGLATTLRRRERQLLAARDRTARTDRLRTVGTMAAGAAHELNTPLSTLGLRLGRIGRRHDDPDTVRDLTVARDQVERCTGIVQQLLFGAGDPSASELVRLPVRRLVDETITLWSKGSRCKVTIDDRSEGAPIAIPRIAFSQALVNLLENAREAQEAQEPMPPIEVRIEPHPGRIVVVIRDHGTGLPPDQDRVGDPFYTTKVSGTGLGVFVARSLAEGAGGGLSYTRLPDGTEARWVFPTT